ncbi:MAG: N-acetyltransferase [Eubacteriales bacterium]
MNIRRGTISDLNIVAEIEKACFLPAEAASEASFRHRLEVYPQYFWLVEQEGKVIAFINGPVIDQMVIDDEMYAEATCHKSDGQWQTVFGINTLPEFRKQGIGRLMLEEVIETARREGRKGCVLTCKDYLLHYYESFGFKSMGVSASCHGGAKWNDMILEF